ncbi:unnamed protein product [Malus baccata var. baccata]
MSTHISKYGSKMSLSRAMHGHENQKHVQFRRIGEPEEIRPWTHMMEVPQLHGFGPAANRLLEAYKMLLKGFHGDLLSFEVSNIGILSLGLLIIVHLVLHGRYPLSWESTPLELSKALSSNMGRLNFLGNLRNLRDSYAALAVGSSDSVAGEPSSVTRIISECESALTFLNRDLGIFSASIAREQGEESDMKVIVVIRTFLLSS